MVSNAIDRGELCPRGNLTNPIHPIFAASNFPQAQIPLDFDDRGFSYEALKPSLRMVSKWLSTPQARLYFFNTFYGRNERLNMMDDQGRQLETYTSDRTISSLSPTDIRAVEAQLAGMAKMVKFTVWPENENTNGWCNPSPGSLEDDLPGVRSNIFLNRRWYDALLNPPAATDNTTRFAPCFDSFNVARIFLHELGHAAHNAVMGQRHDDFYGDSIVAEAGFELEVALFGSLYAGQPGQGPGTMSLFPNSLVMQLYGEGSLPVRNRELIEEVVWIPMSNSYVLASMHEFFWEWAKWEKPSCLIPDCLAEAVQQAMQDTSKPLPLGMARVAALLTNPGPHSIFELDMAYQLGSDGPPQAPLQYRQQVAIRELWEGVGM